jgi:hypothetical protein
MNPASAPSSIISAVVAPAILILACSSLITTTANRLSLLLDRVRSLTAEMESMRAHPSGVEEGKRAFVIAQLRKGAQRTNLLQQTLSTLYIALGCLILTSVCVGVSAAFNISLNFIAVAVLVSVAVLFYASTLLIRESRIALSAINSEMQYVRRIVS